MLMKRTFSLFSTKKIISPLLFDGSARRLNNAQEDGTMVTYLLFVVFYCYYERNLYKL